jgi:hypothetical protein
VASRWTQAATILPPTIKVCGRRLLPFCLRHRVALEAINSPLLSLDSDIRAEDVMAGIKILSSHNIQDFKKPLSFFELIHLHNMRVSKKKLKKEAGKLLLYFQAQSLWPRFWDQDKKGKDIGVDWPLVVVANLTKNGCSLTEAWTMPEAEAVWLHVANLIGDGVDVKLVTETESKAMENELKELEAEKNQQTNKTK